LTGIDPGTQDVVLLFHPQLDKWKDNFEFRDLNIEGTTPTGRTTVTVLARNDARRIELRKQIVPSEA
jgi:hypothetical protein